MRRGVAKNGNTGGGSARCHPFCVTHSLWSDAPFRLKDILLKLFQKVSEDQKKDLRKKIQLIFGSNVDGDSINWNKKIFITN